MTVSLECFSLSNFAAFVIEHMVALQGGEDIPTDDSGPGGSTGRLLHCTHPIELLLFLKLLEMACVVEMGSSCHLATRNSIVIFVNSETRPRETTHETALGGPPNYNCKEMPALQNKRILITRTRHQGSDLAVQLEALGATPILIPTIEIVPPETYAPLDTALTQLETFDWLLFTSANAVEIFHHRLTSPETRVPHLRGGPIAAKVGNRVSDPSSSTEPPTMSLKLPRIAVIGPATAKAVQGIGLSVDLIPPQYIAESLAEALTPYAPNSHMLLIRAEQARDTLPAALGAAGADLTIADAYRNQIPPESIPALQAIFASPATYPDAITFTSASTARNLIALLEAANLPLPPTITLATIGPITSQTLRDLGHPPTLEAPEPTIPALIQSLLIHLSRSTP
jgi:uroporphyrinogen-III synthase